MRYRDTLPVASEGVPFIGAGVAASRVREALRDPVLMSPFIPPGAVPTVLRDTADPRQWHVRSRPVDPQYAARLEGGLPNGSDDSPGPVNTHHPTPRHHPAPQPR